MAMSDLRNVDKPFDARIHFDESAELTRRLTGAGHDVAGLESRLLLLPRPRLSCLDAEADALVIRIDLQHLHLQLIAFLRLARTALYVMPCHLRNMHESIDAADVDECAERVRRCTVPSISWPT